MGPGGAPSGSRTSSLAVLLTAAAAFLATALASGGAGRGVEGAAIGIPTVAGLVLALLAATFVAMSRSPAWAGFLFPVGLGLVSLALGSPAAGLLFSGPPLFALVLAAVVASLCHASVFPPRSLLFPVLAGVYLGASWNVQQRVGPDGDEPQYLMVAESLLHDFDLALDRDFAEKRYLAFFDRPLEPHFRIRGPEGQIYSLHAVGLPVLILPAYAMGGYPAASFFMALLAAFLVREIRRLCREVTGDDATSSGVAWLVGLAPPILHFAGLIFTEIPAALLFCTGLRTSAFGFSKRSGLVSALCAALLPWLNVRYAILSTAIVLALLARLWRERESRALPAHRWLAPLSTLALSALAIALYHYTLWGFFDPRRVYGRRREFSLDFLPEGLPGLFLDQEFGLFVFAPVFALAFAGWRAAWRRSRAFAVAGLIAFVGVVATASVWPMWRGGFNPPARFLVPLTPVLASGVALVLRRGLRASSALLAGWTLWCGLAGSLAIETIHRDRDGTAPFFRTQSGAAEWTSVLPSFVLEEDRATRVLAWPWGVLLVLGVVCSTREKSRRTPVVTETLAASLAFAVTAIIAASLSPRAPPVERNATRLLGHPAIGLSSSSYTSAADAEWSSGVVFEPHRHPNGQAVGSAILLERGRYRARLASADREPGSRPPTLLVLRRGGAIAERFPMSEALEAWFRVDARGEFDLALEGGAPFEVRTVRLSRDSAESPGEP